MSRNRKKSRKRGASPSAGNQLSRSFREARDLITSGRQADGLDRLATLAADSQSPARRAKIALMIATSESGLSRHHEAASAFAKASQLGRQAGNMTLMLQGGVGEIRSLLRSLRATEAQTSAQLLINDLDIAQKEFDQIGALTPAQIAAQGGIVIPPRPPRPTVALTKIANAFIDSGLTAEARPFLEKAILLSPNGAARARQVLAKLCLAADEPADAERYARESLQMGRFQAKTIPAWQLYLDGRARQNRVPILEPALFEALITHAKGRILSASALSVIRVLRAHGDPAWKLIAARILAKPDAGDPIILIEIEKSLHADAKVTLSETPLKLATRALRLFKAENASILEQIAHAKEYVRFSFDANKEPDLALLTRVADKRFGNTHALALRHTAALGAMLSRKYDRARQWLLSLLGDLTPGTESWGKATWALARMEGLLGRDAEAAFWYLEIGADESTPSRFRIQAMLLGFKFLGSSGGSVDVPKISTSVRAILASTTDFRVVLDAARQLGLAGNSFRILHDEAADRSILLADQAFTAAANPSDALSILEYLSRKFHCDLIKRDEDVLKRWERLTAVQKAEFQTVGGSTWYDYVAIVFKSFVSENREAEAAAIAAQIINSDTASSEGYVIVGSDYAVWLLRAGRKNEAFECFEWIAREAPTHCKAAVAHYWLAVRCLKAGEQNSAKASALAVRRCYANSPSKLADCYLDARALLILGMENEPSSYPPGYIFSFAIGQKPRLESDLESL